MKKVRKNVLLLSMLNKTVFMERTLYLKKYKKGESIGAFKYSQMGCKNSRILKKHPIIHCL